jgi:hypothetical protein
LLNKKIVNNLSKAAIELAMVKVMQSWTINRFSLPVGPKPNMGKNKKATNTTAVNNQ